MHTVLLSLLSFISYGQSFLTVIWSILSSFPACHSFHTAIVAYCSSSIMYGHLLHKVIHFLTVNPSVSSSVPYYPPVHSHPYCESFLTGIHSLPSSLPYCQLFRTVIPSLQSFVLYCHSFRTVIASIPYCHPCRTVNLSIL